MTIKDIVSALGPVPEIEEKKQRAAESADCDSIICTHHWARVTVQRNLLYVFCQGCLEIREVFYR